MKRFSAALLAAAVALSPALAFADVVGFPSLTFPQDGAGPATQGCIAPATLAAPACTGE